MKSNKVNNNKWISVNKPITITLILTLTIKCVTFNNNLNPKFMKTVWTPIMYLLQIPFYNLLIIMSVATISNSPLLIIKTKTQQTKDTNLNKKKITKIIIIIKTIIIRNIKIIITEMIINNNNIKIQMDYKFYLLIKTLALTTKNFLLIQT